MSLIDMGLTLLVTAISVETRAILGCRQIVMKDSWKNLTISILVLPLAGIALLSCDSSRVAADDSTPNKATATLRNASGQVVGEATITKQSKGVEFQVKTHDIPAGEHAIHVHEKGMCDPPDFESAGAHFNPNHKSHGLDDPSGPHAGDLPNFTADNDGKADFDFENELMDLSTGTNSLLKAGGTALVIHAKPDDGKTDPSGESGSRIACGVITPAP
jgi:Cu-Zn family superoxide dismutase